MILIDLTPNPSAFLTTASAVLWAANALDFLDPEKPTAPALEVASTLPPGSVIVTIVLLKVA